MNKSTIKIPKTWRVVSLDKIGIITSGGTPSTKEPDFWNGQIPWITPSDLSNYKDIYISKGKRNISEFGLEYSSSKLLPKNTILFSSRAPIGYVAIAKNELTTNQGFKNLSIFEEYTNPKFIYYFLKTIKELAESLASGTTFLELSTNKFKQINIPIAPVEEQNRIINKIEELLSEISTSKKHILDVISKANMYVEKTINNSFKDCNLVRNGKINVRSTNEWAWGTLDDIGTIVGGGTPSTKNNDLWGGNVAWITPADLSNYSEKYIAKGKRNISLEGLNQSSAKLLPKDSILFSSRAPIGYVVLAKNELATSQGFKSIIPFDNISSDFLYYYLKSIKEYAVSKASGTTFLELSATNFKKIPVPIPTLEEQKNIVNNIETAINYRDSIIKELNYTLEKCEHLSSKILIDAYQGKLLEQFDLDTPVDITLKNIEALKVKFDLNRTRKKEIKQVRVDRKKLIEFIVDFYGRNSFTYLDLANKEMFSSEKLKSEFEKYLKENKIIKFFDESSMSVKYKLK